MLFCLIANTCQSTEMPDSHADADVVRQEIFYLSPLLRFLVFLRSSMPYGIMTSCTTASTHLFEK